MEYITLSNCAATLVKKFRVFSGGYSSTRRRQNSVQRTWRGKLDNQVARSVKVRRYVLLIYVTELTDMGGLDADTEGYGTLGHLTQFFEVNQVETGACASDPSLVAANLLTMTDFDENDYDVLLVGPLYPKNLGKSLNGTSGVYHVPVELLVID